MTQSCVNCGSDFQITEADLIFLEKVSPVFNNTKEQIPSPIQCPDCRRANRMVFRNLRSLYYRTCDFSGKTMMSIYGPESEHTVYDESVWWSDAWNELDYGRDFDFNRTFFDQFHDLYKATPLLNRYVVMNENSDYINGAGSCKNCYLCFDLDYVEDSYYITGAHAVRSSVDCFNVLSCELCYECVDCEEGYRLFFSERCTSCSDSAFLLDCKRCRNCIGCCNLVDKEYHIFNKPVTPEEFERQKQALLSRSGIEHMKVSLKELAKGLPRKYYFGHSNENFTGDNIRNTKNCFSCFDGFNIENCTYCTYLYHSHDCMDVTVFGEKSEWLYNCIGTGRSCSMNAFNMYCWEGCSNTYYCHLINSCKNCFGCSGMKGKQYCIFNKQYSKEEYEELVPRIIEHMKKTGEWGLFFPMTLCPFGYNETIAHEHHPLTKEEVFARGLRWTEERETAQQGARQALPETITDTPDSITSDVLTCEVTGKSYKIIPQELRFYREQGLPIPSKCPDQRHKERFAQRNPRKLWNRECMNCSKPIQTTYTPTNPAIVYCESCYLEAVY